MAVHDEEGRPTRMEELARRAEMMAPVEEQVSGLSMSDLDGAVRAAFERGFRLGAKSLAGELRETAEEIEADKREEILDSRDREWNAGAEEQAKSDREAIEKIIEPVRFSLELPLVELVKEMPASTPASRMAKLRMADKTTRDVHRDLPAFAETHGSIHRGRVRSTRR